MQKLRIWDNLLRLIRLDNLPDYLSRVDSFDLQKVDRETYSLIAPIYLTPEEKEVVKYKIDGEVKDNGQFTFELTDESIIDDKINIRFVGDYYEPLEQILDLNNHKAVNLKVDLTALPKEFVDVVGSPDIIPKMELIPADTFIMGDVLGDNVSLKETPHTVSLNSYYLGTYEVTYEEYDRFTKAKRVQRASDNGWGRDQQPVVNISWYEAIEYCNWLSSEHGYEPVYTIDKTEKAETNQNKQDTTKLILMGLLPIIHHI